MRRVVLLAVVVAAVGGFTGVVGAEGGPMADAGLDQTVTVETTVQLDGTGSTHADGSIADHEWTIRTPDGREIVPECPTCERSQFTPAHPGRYEVTLTVTGQEGREASDTLYVYVEDAGPGVELDGPRAPAPGESVTFRANAESADAELEEIAWAVEDRIVAVRPLEGTTDASELTAAFSASETYRVQVVVRDSNGRTAYDQLTVHPRDGGATGSSSWSDTDVDPPGPSPELDCNDSEYRSSNLMDCIGAEGPGMGSPSSKSPTYQREHIHYQTSGYESTLFAGMRTRDSTNVGGLTRRQTGLDGGENAPWNRELIERGYEESVGRASRILLGQERRTITCEMTGGSTLDSKCAQKAKELEENGETTNVNSGGSGLYSEYGLRNGERVRGNSPNDLEEGQTAEVTIVVQEEKEGLVDRAGRAVDTSAEWVHAATDGVLGDDEEETASSTTSGSTRSSDADETDGDREYSAPESLHSSTVVSRTGVPKNPGDEL